MIFRKCASSSYPNDRISLSKEVTRASDSIPSAVGLSREYSGFMSAPAVIVRRRGFSHRRHRHQGGTPTR